MFICADPKHDSPRLLLNRPQLITAFEHLDSAVIQACDLHKQQASSKEGQRVESMLEILKATVSKIPNNTPGEHALAWIYFVAATKSRSDEHRSFFSVSLANLYKRLGFGNISSSFELLHRSWASG